MASLADYHPAFELPPPNLSCCLCFGVPPITCPGVGIEARQCSGSFSRPGPCGFLNDEDDLYYLQKTITRSKVTREKDPPPPTLSCDFVEGISGSYQTTIGTTTEEVEYVALQVDTCVVDPVDYSCNCSTETDEEVYELIRQRVRVYDSDDDDCNGSNFEANGEYITELDPDLSTEVTEFADEWTPLSSGEVKARTSQIASENCGEEDEWDDTAVGISTIAYDLDGNVEAASMATATTRFRITGGFTGYFRFTWGILDENSTLVEQTEVVYTWDPTLGPLNVTLPGPDLTPDYGTDNIDSVRIRDLIIVDFSCIPPEEEE